MNKSNIKYAFFGSSEFSVIVLNEMEIQGFTPSLIITSPDKPKGRGLIMTPTNVKIWGNKRNIPVETPVKLDDDFIKNISGQDFDLFVVASYGKIIPENVLDLPKYKSLNIHPSLLPKYRGASPLQSMILADDRDGLGVSIMIMDKEMDHGPILTQKRLELPDSAWPIKLMDLKKLLGSLGAKILTSIIPEYICGKISALPQTHGEATFTKKINKTDGLIKYEDISNEPRKTYLKFCAFSEWPKLYFFINKDEKDTRIIITDVEYDKSSNKMILKKVICEGRPEMPFEHFESSFLRSGL